MVKGDFIRILVAGVFITTLMVCCHAPVDGRTPQQKQESQKRLDKLNKEYDENYLLRNM